MIDDRSGPARTGLAVALCICSVGAYAQVFPYRLYSGPHLGKSDYAAMHEAAQTLLMTDAGRIGASESWNGGASGNAGTLTVQQALRKQGHDCRAIKATTTYRSGASHSRLVDVCQVPGAGWKIVS